MHDSMIALSESNESLAKQILVLLAKAPDKTLSQTQIASDLGMSTPSGNATISRAMRALARKHLIKEGSQDVPGMARKARIWTLLPAREPPPTKGTPGEVKVTDSDTQWYLHGYASDGTPRSRAYWKRQVSEEQLKALVEKFSQQLLSLGAPRGDQ